MKGIRGRRGFYVRDRVVVTVSFKLESFGTSVTRIKIEMRYVGNEVCVKNCTTWKCIEVTVWRRQRE